MKRIQTSESMKELQRTYSPVCKRNGSTGDLLSQTDSLDGMHYILIYAYLFYVMYCSFLFVLLMLLFNFRL